MFLQKVQDVNELHVKTAITADLESMEMVINVTEEGSGIRHMLQHIKVYWVGSKTWLLLTLKNGDSVIA